MPMKSAVDEQTKLQAMDAADSDHARDIDIPVLFHALIAACLVTMVLLSRYAFASYAIISQEDHAIEWATVVFYLPAAFIGFRYAIRHRRIFDGLIALYCLFTGGEEFSWGQRLLGFSPPKFFMEKNVQQEFTLHNLFSEHAHDLIFSILVIGYGVVLPLLARQPRARQFLEKVGASVPPIEFAPWCIFLIALYVWYPIHLSSEWIETIVAAIFLAGSALLAKKRLTSKAILITVSLVFITSVALTNISNAQESKGTPERIACAKAEVQSLLYDIIHGGAATEKLLQYNGSIHRRIWVAENSGYLRGDHFSEFKATRCNGTTVHDEEARYQYGLDPWGLSYWFYIESLGNGEQRLTVYSFGPNRRRDSNEGTPGGDGTSDDDDIAATGTLSNKTKENIETDTPSPIPFSTDFTP